MKRLVLQVKALPGAGQGAPPFGKRKRRPGDPAAAGAPAGGPEPDMGDDPGQEPGMEGDEPDDGPDDQPDDGFEGETDDELEDQAHGKTGPGAAGGGTPAPDLTADSGAAADAQATQEWAGDVYEDGDETDPAQAFAAFQGQGGEEAWLDRQDDGTLTGWLRDADGTVYRYQDADAWAVDVDDAGMGQVHGPSGAPDTGQVPGEAGAPGMAGQPGGPGAAGEERSLFADVAARQAGQGR